MSVLGGWLLAPLVLGLLVVGCGLLAERLAGVRLPGALVPPVGLATLIVVAGPFTLLDATAELAPVAVAVAATAGVVLARPWRDARLSGEWRVPCALVVAAYLAFAVPSLGTGQGSIAGYVKLDDSATWLATTDQIFSHGRDLSWLAPSTYSRTLEEWLGGGYPVGSFLPLGVSAKLTAQDPAGAYQATIAVFAAILALGLYACARPLARSPAPAALAAWIAVQASLFFGYAQWGGIKEAATVALLPPLALLTLRAAHADGARWLGLLCVVAGAVLAVLSVPGGAWAAPALAIGAGGFAIARRRQGPRGGPSLALVGGGLAALLAAASLPVLLELGFLRHTTDGAISAQDEIGNLGDPLSLLQGLGLWPTADFRNATDPSFAGPLLALAGGALAAVCVGLALRRRRLELPALVLLTGAGVVPAVVIGSPWIDAKALAVLAPVVLLCTAGLGILGMSAARKAVRAASAAGLGLLAVCAVLSTVAAASEVFVAPRERLAELRAVGDQIAGEGPTLVLNYEIYAQRHFLRDADPEGATDLRVRAVPRTNGRSFPKQTTAEVDDVATSALWVYRTIVRRRSPASSRPPSAYEMTATGRAFEVWQRDSEASPPILRLPLGKGLDPTGVPDCRRVRALARLPGVHSLAAVPRQPPVVVDLAGARTPAEWQTTSGLQPASDGHAELAAPVPAPGRWRVWIGGSVRGRLGVRFGDREVGSARHELAHAGQWIDFGTIDVPGRSASLDLAYSRSRRVGAGGSPEYFGPLALSPVDADLELPVVRIPPREHRRLCRGGRYDWIEALP